MAKNRRAKVLDLNLAAAPVEGGLMWLEVRALGLEGQGWTDTQSPYDRLPARAEALVPPLVWQLGQNSAGLSVHFVTDARKIAARWRLRVAQVASPHMAATGVSGLGLHVRARGLWRHLMTTQPAKFPDGEGVLAAELPGRRLEYRLYLPLYNGVETVHLGLPPEAHVATFAPQPPGRRIVFYGTSIVQGGCASRPGMAYPAILGRRLGRETINLGFSGSGRMEPALAELIAELEAAAYVLDCLPNLQPTEAVERVEPFVRLLRGRRPRTPIVLVESIRYEHAPYAPTYRERTAGINAALRAAYRRMTDSGIAGLHYVPGDRLLGDDGEATVDGVHPTDVGFLRMADVLEPALRKVLSRPRRCPGSAGPKRR